jgi:hypothetical protein
MEQSGLIQHTYIGQQDCQAQQQGQRTREACPEECPS